MCCSSDNRSPSTNERLILSLPSQVTSGKQSTKHNKLKLVSSHPKRRLRFPFPRHVNLNQVKPKQITVNWSNQSNQIKSIKYIKSIKETNQSNHFKSR